MSRVHNNAILRSGLSCNFSLVVLADVASSNPLVIKHLVLVEAPNMVKLAFGNIGDSLSLGSFKAYLSEFIATLLFVFAGVGSAIAFSEFHEHEWLWVALNGRCMPPCRIQLGWLL